LSTALFLLLSGTMFLPLDDGPQAATPTATDLPRLRELLADRQHPRTQSQAALLLIQDRTAEGDAIVRQGLRQSDSPEVFLALATALRLRRDGRFTTELLDAMRSAPPAIRQAAAETLAEQSDSDLITQLRGIAEDLKLDRAARQAAIWTLGHGGSKAAVAILLDLLSSADEAIRTSATDALGQLTGQTFGVDLASWRVWWGTHKDMDNEHWLEERLAYQAVRSRRVEGDLERARAQIVRLHQQLYARLPPGDRLGHVQELIEAEDSAVRLLAVNWSLELLPSADAVGQHALGDLLIRLSQDGAPEVQRSAVLALGSILESRAFDRLRILVRQGPTSVRAAAARSLAQQVHGTGPEVAARQRQVISALQNALDDADLDVVVEAAEGLGSLGVPEAGPVLTVLLRHPSQPVRQTAALALERVADVTSLAAILDGLNDAAVAVRFSLVGAVAHAAADSRAVNEQQRTQLTLKLEDVLLRDADPGVRSRAATVLGECGAASVLPTLWGRLLASEDTRVQEKCWTALVEILCLSGNLELLRQWDGRLVDTRQGARRLQLLTEIYARWLKRDDTKNLAIALVDSLIGIQLEQGKWTAAYPLARESLGRVTDDQDLDKRLRWLLAIGEQAQKEGNKAETLRVIQDVQPYLARRPLLGGDFERLERLAKSP
jgi:HEAT repeat protein